MRTATLERKTKETDIRCTLIVHAPGEESACNVNTGVGFLDHMIDALSRHGGFSIDLTCSGDLHIDQHHTIEDVGIVLGQAFAQALGDGAGIERFGLMECPLDEALVKVVVDISGRPFLHYGVKFHRPFIGTLDSSLLREFLGGFVLHARWTVHIDALRGENDHHVAEAMFKAFARAARQAVRASGQSGIPSTKGVL